jgi:hypothetical protein
MSTNLFLFTLVHVAISLIGIASGFVVMAHFLKHTPSRFWTNLFLTTTILTSVSGFGFPFVKVTPGIVLGVLSLIVLALAIYAHSARHLDGRWNTTYIVSALVAQYFNVFVLVVQSFQKVPFLKMLAPTQSEAPFAITQLVVLAAFVTIGILSVKRNRLATPVLATA